MVMIGLLPFIIIAVMISATNFIVRRSSTATADRMAEEFVREATKRVNKERENVDGELQILHDSILSIDPSVRNAEELVCNIATSILSSTPYIYCIWFGFEEGEFFQDKRFLRDYIKLENGEVIDLDDWYEDELDDPELSPWYYYPYTTGEKYFISADYYDYGYGSHYTDTMSRPLTRDGKIAGVIGIDTVYDQTLSFIDEMQIEDERFVMVITHHGDIVYSTGGEYTTQSILDLPYGQKEIDCIIECMSMDESIDMRGISPVSGVKSHIYCDSIYNEQTTEQLYLYVDFNASALYKSATDATSVIIIIGVAGLIMQGFFLLSLIRDIFTPFRKLYRNANMIAEGNSDIDLYSELTALQEKNTRSKNELYKLFGSLKNMLNQINRSKELEVENISIQTEKERAEASARSKSDFLAKMSHEIRTPMNAIIGMTELALREDISEFAREHIITIKQAGANLLCIINDILDFSKIEDGKLKIVSSEYLFSSLVNDVISIIRMRVIDLPIRFMVNLDGNIPNSLIGDEAKIRQVLLNLLNNAVKYTEKGFVSLLITGEINEDTINLKIEVSDSGRGIKREDMDKLFADFSRIDVDHNKAIEGTGLGLVIAKNIANAMDGDISVDSEFGKGSTFTLTLPQKISSYKKIAAVENPDEKSVLIYERNEMSAGSLAYTLDNLGVDHEIASNDSRFYEKMSEKEYSFVFVTSEWLENAKKISGRLESKAKTVLLTKFGETPADRNLRSLAMPVNAISVANILNGVTDSFNYTESGERIVRFAAPSAKVLVVDDIKTNLKVTEGLLLPYRVQVKLCQSGIAAIEEVKAHHYDMILMDHMMPEMDGMEAVKHIRELDGGEDFDYKKLPIVALTANAVAGVKEMFLKNGFDEFMSKPIDTVKLNAIMEKFIPKEKQRQLTKTEEDENAGSSIRADGEKDCRDIKIKGIDVTKGVFMTGGTVSNYLETLSVFYSDGIEKIKEIKTCLEKGNIKSYVIYVHALKGASASLGAIELSESAKALEIAGKSGDTDFISDNTDKLLHDLEELLNNISEVIAENIGEIPDDYSINTEELKSELVNLKNALDKFDFGAIDGIVSMLQKYTHTDDIGTPVRNILQNILIGGYDEAVSQINDLLDTDLFK